MKLTRKHLVLVAIPMVMVTTTGAYALSRPDQQAKNNTITVVSPENQPESAAPQGGSPQPSVEVPTKLISTPLPSASAPVPPPVPTPQPSYGEDPNNPGVFIVFDKITVMTQAGISADDQSTVDTLIGKLMQWRYKQTAFPESDLCYVVPTIKMAPYGSDYANNPVTQLKFCNAYAIGRYGSWSNALDHFNVHGYPF